MKHVTLLISLIAFSFNSFTQCNSDFLDSLNTSTPNPYDIKFEDISTGWSTIANTSIEWTFSSGTPSVYISDPGDTVIVLFPGPGTYSVCHELTDTGNCFDSTCALVSIPGTPFSTTINSTNAQCGNCNGTALATASGGTSPYSFLWSNGSTTDSISGLCQGTYTVTITDSFDLTSIDTVTVQNIGGISATISASSNNPCPGDTVILTATSNGSGSIDYFWNNGDSGSTTFVLSSGTYTVTVTDSSLCSGIDTISIMYSPPLTLAMGASHETCLSCCDGTAGVNVFGGSGNYLYNWSNGSTIDSAFNLCPGTHTVSVTDTNTSCQFTNQVNVNAFSSCYMINGMIAQGSGTKMYLIEETSGFLTAIDSTLTDSTGDYSFYDVCNGTYYVKAALLPSHPSYGSHVPTYYDTTALWSQANALILNNASMNNIDISLLSGTNPGGPGFVGGLISQGANRDEGDPVPNVQFILTNLNDEVVAFTKSTASGEYALNNLALGDYKLYVDILNKTSYPMEFALTAESDRIESGNFQVFDSYVKPEAALGVIDMHIKSSKLFPNPASNDVWIESSSIIEELIIYSISGQILSTAKPNVDRIQLTLNALSAGQYIVQVRTNSTIDHHILVKE